MEELIKKTLYCVRMMNLVKRLSNVATNDYKKRIISRSIFVYLDAFFNFAPQIKNSLDKKDVNVKSINEKISKIRDEYEDYYSKIRDKLTAHRQDLPILETFEVWNDIDVTTLDYFITEVLDIYNLLHGLKRNEITSYSDFTIASVELKPSTSNIPTTPSIASDNLALTRPNTISLVAINQIQYRGTQINSIIDTIYYLASILPDEAQSKDLERLIKSMLIVDLINLLDNLYPYNPSDGSHKIESFYEISNNENLKGYQILVQSYTTRNIALEERIRTIRNKICAHIDTTESLETLLDYLDKFTIDEFNLLFVPLRTAFKKSCQADVRTKMLLMNNIKFGDNVIAVEDTGLIKDFEK